jgi:hypothetical protein
MCLMFCCKYIIYMSSPTATPLSLTKLATKAVMERLTEDLINPFNFTSASISRAFIKDKLKRNKKIHNIPKELCSAIVNAVPARALYVALFFLSLCAFTKPYIIRVRCKKCRKAKHVSDCYLWHYSNDKYNNKPRKWRTEAPTYFSGLGHVTFTCYTCTPPCSPAEKY